MRWAVVAFILAGCGRVGFEDRRVGDVDASTNIDASTDAAPLSIDAPGTLGCGSTILIDDPFNDAVPGPSFVGQPSTGLTLVESAGHLDVQFAATVDSSFSYYRSTIAYPAEGLCATAEVTQTPDAPASAYLKLRTAQLEVEMITVVGAIALRTRQSGAATTRQQIALDLVQSRYWRIRQLAGTTYWETSPDGATYTTHTMLAGFFTPMSCQVELGAGSQSAASNAGVARFEGIVVAAP